MPLNRVLTEWGENPEKLESERGIGRLEGYLLEWSGREESGLG